VTGDPSGFLCIKLANGPISWVSRKQRMVTLASDEPEYVNLSEASKEGTSPPPKYNERDNW
jgi:hypothetical protein